MLYTNMKYGGFQQRSQYFLVPHIDTVFALDKPLVAHRVKLLIHSGLMAPSGRLCWHLTFLGCRLTDS